MSELIPALIHSTIPFIDITALASLIGAALCLLFLAQPAAGSAGYPQVFLHRLRRLVIICLSLLVVSTIIGLFGRGMEMSGFGFTDSLPLLPTVVFKTHYGSMWLLRVAGLSSAWIVLITAKVHTGPRLFGAFLLLAGATLAFARSATGHPADFGDLSPKQLADWLHLLAVASWGGSLLILAGIFPPALVEKDNLQQQLVAGIADRFYLLFGPLLSVLVSTGLYNAWFQVGSFQALVTTPYGGLLSAKILLLLFLAFRYIAPPEHGRDEALFVKRFLHRTRLEAGVIFALLLCAALLVHQIPARHFLHLQHLQDSGSHAGHSMDHKQ
jgi:putative copper resistance protein D